MKAFKKPFVILIIFAVILIIIFFPYIKAEYFTLKYGKQFEGLEEQTNMLSNSRYYKVLSYSKSRAKVFYVSNTGDVITFEKNSQGVWQIKDWYTVWSHYGSADNFYWPYYR